MDPVVASLLDMAEQAGVAVWYRRLLPEALAVYMREPDLPPVITLDCDVMLDPALHAGLLAMLLVKHRTMTGDKAWVEVPPSGVSLATAQG